MAYTVPPDIDGTAMFRAVRDAEILSVWIEWPKY